MEDSLVLLDECHKAKNLVPEGGGASSKTGRAVLELQQKLPEARFCFCSATGVSAVKSMAYMHRLGLWGLGTGFQDRESNGDHFGMFLKEIAPTKRQSPAVMELIALEMKQRGMYLSRQLAFAGAEFEVNHIDLTEPQIDIYDSAAKVWQTMLSCFDSAAEVVGDKANHKVFWAAHQRFFRTLLMSLKVPSTVELCKEALKSGMCVVIGLQSTGESRMDEAVKNGVDVNEFLALKDIIFQVLRFFPSMDPPEPDKKRVRRGSMQVTDTSEQDLTHDADQPQIILSPAEERARQIKIDTLRGLESNMRAMLEVQRPIFGKFVIF